MGLVLDAVLPVRCAACAEPGFGWCRVCAAAAEGLRLTGGGAVLLTPAVAAVGVYAYDGVVRDAVRGMKLSGRSAAAADLGCEIRALAVIPAGWQVTWVPSTRRRRRQRGFDLPRLLAGPGAVGLLERTFEGPDQTELTSQQRRSFPPDAFRAISPLPRCVVLIDDVRTTGATATAAAGALTAAGASHVLVATLAVGGDAARSAAAR